MATKGPLGTFGTRRRTASAAPHCSPGTCMDDHGAPLPAFPDIALDPAIGLLPVDVPRGDAIPTHAPRLASPAGADPILRRNVAEKARVLRNSEQASRGPPKAGVSAAPRPRLARRCASLTSRTRARARATRRRDRLPAARREFTVRALALARARATRRPVILDLRVRTTSFASMSGAATVAASTSSAVISLMPTPWPPGFSRPI